MYQLKLETITEVYSVPITTVKFDSTNFLTSSQSMKLTIIGCRKWGCITRETKAPSCMDPTYEKCEAKAPSHTDPTYTKCEAENDLAMSWFIHSMESSISKMCLFFSLIKHI